MTSFFYSSSKIIDHDFLPRQLRLQDTQQLLIFSSLPGDTRYLEKMYHNPALEFDLLQDWPFFLENAFVTNPGYPGGLDLFKFLLNRGYGSRIQKIEKLAWASLDVCDLTRKRPLKGWERPLPKGSMEKLEVFLEYLLQSRDVWRELEEHTKGMLGRLIVLFASPDSFKSWLFSVTRHEFFPDSVMRPLWTEAPSLFSADRDRLHAVVVHMFKNEQTSQINEIVGSWLFHPGNWKSVLEILDKYYQLKRYLSEETLTRIQSISETEK